MIPFRFICFIILNSFRSQFLGIKAECRIPDLSRFTSVQCLASDFKYPCQGAVPPRTIVTFTCPPRYHAASLRSVCLKDGNWSEPVKCTPDCGYKAALADAIPLILYGAEHKTPTQWPWAAALHRRSKGDAWELICGGTLIADNAVITAAHCVQNFARGDFKVVLGYLFRDLPEENADKLIYEVKRTYVLPVYRGISNSFNSDIAIMILASRVQLSDDITPACLPDHRITVTPYTIAAVSGWGLDENQSKSKILKHIKVPIVDSLKCIKYIPKAFTRYLSYSAFCAGYLNGTGVCNGDSGSGLLTQVDGQWVVQGVISISPRKGTANVCHPRSFSLYTKVMIYTDWINKVLEFEESKSYEEENKINARRAKTKMFKKLYH